MRQIEQKKNNCNGFIILAIIFLFMYVLNFLTPLGFGDDYLYSFIWQGQAMDAPLTKDAVRISSWTDLFLSQWSHYFTWGGRTVAHVLAQFFLWKGKDLFNFINSFVFLLLIAEIYWCVNKGRLSFSFNSKRLCWIFFVLWAFTPGFTPVFLWLTGSCNYLWTTVLLLAFIIPFLQNYYLVMTDERNILFSYGMFLLGILAGWTNENNVCWIIVMLSSFCLISYKKNLTINNWMITGLVGLILGYALLLLAPGNMNRLIKVHGTDLNIIQTISNNFPTFFKVILCQFFLWYFVVRSLYSLKYVFHNNVDIKKDMKLVAAFCIVSFGMTFIMLLVPEFPERSGFFGTIWLIIAAGILIRIQEQYNITLVQESAKKFIKCVGIIYFTMTAVITVRSFYGTYVQTQELMRFVSSKKGTETVVVVKSFIKAGKYEKLLSGFHIIDNELLPDENCWENIAFARYYGIKGIRVETDKDN